METGTRREQTLAATNAAPNSSVETGSPNVSSTSPAPAPARRPNYFWERQPGESAAAYRAFCVYRDLGPTRSLRKAWEKATGEQQKSNIGATVPGRWTAWSSRFSWFNRAEAFDEATQCPIFQLERSRANRRIYSQLAYTQMADKLLDNLCTELPYLLLTERVRTLGGEKSIIRATSPGGLAMLLRELREYEQALHAGFVPESAGLEPLQPRKAKASRNCATIKTTKKLD